MFGWRRSTAGRPRRPHLSAVPAVGIGALVVVQSDPSGIDEWEGQPSGVVIGQGGNQLVPYPGLSAGPIGRWLVAFDELAYMADGRGPFEQASIPAWRLVPVPTVEDGAAG